MEKMEKNNNYIVIKRPSYGKYLTDDFLKSTVAKQMSGADWRVYLWLIKQASETGAGATKDLPLLIAASEVAKAVRISAQPAADLALKRLRDFGLITWEKGRRGTARKIYILGPEGVQ